MIRRLIDRFEQLVCLDLSISLHLPSLVRRMNSVTGLIKWISIATLLSGTDSLHHSLAGAIEINIVKMLKFAVLLVTVGAAFAHHAEGVHNATAVLVGKNVQGTITFSETDDHKIRVQGTITGLPAGEYGFHVHEKGDLSGGCATAGGHFNPNNQHHGHPNDAERHVGDLGNVVFNDQGVSTLDFVDSQLALRGPNNILGRAVVLHEKADDFGRTDHPDSRKTGNAGGRVACGVIGLL